ncbi:MAG: glycosyltransferase family 39 protein [Anaerolineae bacterium]|nr:glycosyltransferase family 39 protein [Candidatus Roseilinea sp.]MDW8450158.1 glycosyltransferase family 39 protein [Anaerolineae bacterium]
MDSHRRHWPLAVIVVTYFVIGSLFVLRTPAWQNPDEPAHYNYTRQLVRSGSIPIIEPGDWVAGLVPIGPDVKDVPVDRMTYEDHQPPLFYLLSAPVFIITGGQLVALRLFALLIGAFVIVFAYFTVAAIFPEHRYLAAFAAAFIALLPQHLAIMASYNNDALSEALLALAVLLSIRLVMRRDTLTMWHLVVLAIVVGLCFVTKAQAYLALPVALIGVFLTTKRTDPPDTTDTPDTIDTTDTPDTPNALSSLLLVLGLSALIGLPWWLRSAGLYGGADFLGLQRHNEVVVGQPTTAEWLAEYGLGGVLSRLAQTTFQSFWGQFGWMSIPLDRRIYLALLAFTLVSAALFLAWWVHGRAVRRRLSGRTQARAGEDLYSPYLLLAAQQSRALTLLACLALFTMLAYAWYNLQFVQHQGRYLYPALIPIATAFALGWGFLFSRREAIGRWLWLFLMLGLAALDAYLLFRVILPQMNA